MSGFDIGDTLLANRVMCKATQLGGENDEFQHNRASNA
jgi:hypothetical protein